MIYGNSVGGTGWGKLPAPETAEVGQILLVSEVSEDGRIVATEASFALVELTKDLEALRADFEYDEIILSNFKNIIYDAEGVRLAGPASTTVAEIGKTIVKMEFAWNLSKDPASQIVNGKSVAVDLRTATVSDLAITATAPGQSFSYSMSATDERDVTVSATTYIKFLNGIYCGVLEDGVAVDSAAILSLGSPKLQDSRSTTFTATATATQRHAYALPSARYGPPAFKDKDTGFEAGFTKAYTIDFTNGSGYTESYDVWLSNHPGLGTMTVTVS